MYSWWLCILVYLLFLFGELVLVIVQVPSAGLVNNNSGMRSCLDAHSFVLLFCGCQCLKDVSSHRHLFIHGCNYLSRLTENQYEYTLQIILSMLNIFYHIFTKFFCKQIIYLALDDPRPFFWKRQRTKYWILSNGVDKRWLIIKN